MVLSRLGRFKRAVGKRLSRTRFLARMLGIDIATESPLPGMIMIQVDGLSREQFEAAIDGNRLPFLKRMMKNGHFTTASFYSGVPSTTPAVQAEVMYGIRSAVPAFQFVDRATGRVFRMSEQPCAKEVAAELSERSEPLLKDGSSYSNIFSGGSSDAFGCSETADANMVLQIINPVKILAVCLTYSLTLLRIMGLTVVELGIAVFDMAQGILQRRDWKSELKFVPARGFICIVMREWLRVLVKLAIERGSPVVYANFLAYDEQAHLRGPSSRFAHWGLKGIDGVIRDVYRSAASCGARNYEIVVFSDHGQEDTSTYESLCGSSIEDAIKRAAMSGPFRGHRIYRTDQRFDRANALHQKMRAILRKRSLVVTGDDEVMESIAEHIVVTALGPLGHIYFPVQLSDQEKFEFAGTLVEQEHIPLVVFRDAAGTVHAGNASGVWRLPQDVVEVAGSAHPFPAELGADLVELGNLPNSGDLIISGWNPNGSPVTFAEEQGAHGGIGTHETRGFAMLPDALKIQLRQSGTGEDYVRGEDLYSSVRRFLEPHGQHDEAVHISAADRRHGDEVDPGMLRVMTYNIHSAIGLDGRHRPDRIAQVIDSCGADIIALQEVDVHQARTDSCDQPNAIAAMLNMNCSFFSVRDASGGKFGLAILSRYAINPVRSELLTESSGDSRAEARGAMWAEIDTPHGRLNILNTHFGLTMKERSQQLEMLLGENWLARLPSSSPVIVCGDFNAGPKSSIIRQLSKKLSCVQSEAVDHRPKATFASVMPIRQLDHILTSNHFTIGAVTIPRTPTAVVASDHLPICAAIQFRPVADLQSASAFAP
jgi:endonuclease/exonuclease/phosphatase family metal-dependent hydrolase